jgi:Zn-dependent protease
MLQMRLFGIPVVFESGILFLSGIYLLLGLNRNEAITTIVAGILAVFGSILWHELGHAMAARTFGLGRIAIRLHGLGGVTSHAPSGSPYKDLAIVLAGPGAGFVLGAVALVAWMAIPGGTLASTLAGEVALINLFWSAFNLLPFFPLDGGQALSAVLRIAVPASALLITAVIGFLGGASIGLFGLFVLVTGGFGGIFLLLIAGMVVQNNLALWERVRAR